jgi:hypothetical protein
MTAKILSSCHPVGQPDSMTRSYLVTLKAPMVSTLEAKLRRTAFKPCFQLQRAPLHIGLAAEPNALLALRLRLEALVGVRRCNFKVSEIRVDRA